MKISKTFNHKYKTLNDYVNYVFYQGVTEQSVHI